MSYNYSYAYTQPVEVANVTYLVTSTDDFLLDQDDDFIILDT